MRHDYFIHAFNVSPDERKHENFPFYESAIIEAVSRAESPISASCGDVFDKIILPERKIHTIPDPYFETGKISKDQSDRIRKIIRPGDEHRIHGAYLGKCTAEFAVQLFGLIEFGEYWPDFPDRPWGMDMHYHRRMAQRARVYDLLNANAIGKSNVKYGVIFAAKDEPLETNAVRQKLHAQLTDVETVIF